MKGNQMSANLQTKEPELPMPLIERTEMASFLELIDKVIASPELDADKLDKLLSMQERILDRSARQQFNQAMTAAQSEMPVVVADKRNPHTRSKYPSLENVQTSIKEISLRHGFTCTFAEEPPVDGKVHLIGIVRHVGGHTEIFNRYAAPDTKGPSGTPNKTDVQGSQSTVTYLSRRLLCAIFNITVKDDDKDGNDNSGPKISADQYTVLKDLAIEVKANIPRFCQFMKIETLDQLAASRFDEAQAELERKRK
jgi:hypothetical protein